MKTHSTHQKIISPQMILFLLITAFIGIAMIFSVIFTAPRTQQTSAASCGCNPPPDTHGWTDNMCFFPPETAGCPQTFPGGYCDPNGDTVYDDADWEKGYYEYRTLCPNSPTGGVVPTVGISGTVSPTSVAEPTPTAIPTQKPLDLNECIGHGVDVYAQVETVRKLAGNELAEKLLNKYREICTGRNQEATPVPSTSPQPTGVYPTSPTGNGDLYDMNELLHPSSRPSSGALQAANNCMSLRSSYESASQALGWPQSLWPVIAGIDFREDSCRAEASCIDGKTVVGNAVPSLGINCSSTETTPGSPVKIGGGCGFKDKTHALRWCVKHLIGKGYITGKDIPTNMQELGQQVAGYNGVPGNTNCRTGVPYEYCPPPFKYADNLYAFNKYFTPTYPNYEKMWLIFCDDGVQCDFSDPNNIRPPFSGMGVMAVAQAITWLLNGGN